MILEIGLKPTIINIATLIASSIADNAFSGLYDVSALIITGFYEDSDAFYQYYCIRLIREKLYAYLQIHERRPTVFFNFEEFGACKSLGNWVTDVDQILEKGRYSQISSTGYMIRFSLDEEMDEAVGVYEYDGKSYKKPKQINNAYTFIILKKGQFIDQEGFTKSFFARNCDVKKISKN